MTKTLYMTYTSPPSRSVLMTVFALQIDVNLKPINMMSREQFSDWFLQLNPRHCVPTLNDDGFILWESRSIMRYLVNEYGHGSSLYPNDNQQRAQIDNILDFDIGQLYKTIYEYARPQIFELAEASREKLQKVLHELEVLEAILTKEKSDWLVGDNTTLADFSVISSLSLLEAVDFDFSPFVNIAGWRERCKSLQVYKSSNEKFEQWKVIIKTPNWTEMIKARLSS